MKSFRFFFGSKLKKKKLLLLSIAVMISLIINRGEIFLVFLRCELSSIILEDNIMWFLISCVSSHVKNIPLVKALGLFS